MGKIKAVLFILLALFSPVRSAHCASSAPDSYGSVDTGIEERLGGAVPGDLTFYDETGGRVALGSLINRPTILILAYYGCTNLCNTVLSNAADVLGRLSSAPGADYSVLTVSFDEKDTPELAQRKKKNYIKAIGRPFPEGAWRFLTGDKQSISALASSVGFEYAREEKGFTHPSSLVIVSPEKKIIRYIYGSSYLPSELEMAFAEAREGSAGPTIPKILLFCYTYDPAKNRHVFDFMKASGLTVLFFASGFFIYVTRKNRKP